MPLYEEKLINPLAVRFSQDRIWPDFQDGHQIEDSLTEISTVRIDDAYDLVLRPPFPPMEIIRLRQERRENDGERMRDDSGKRVWGEESWFTFDNRRLYCLQRAALQLWPTVVAVVVKVLFDFPAVRCARHKFRTTSDGQSVKISLPDGQPGSLWNWETAAKGVQISKERALAVSEALEAVRRDSAKHKKEMLDDAPPIATLCPGARNTTVAERFNLGSSESRGNDSGKAAGMQLLSLLKSGGDDANAFGQAPVFEKPAAVQRKGWHYSSGYANEAYDYDDGGEQDQEGCENNNHMSNSKGYGKGSNRGPRRRGRKGKGKGDANAS